jgi:predicted dehydrogenase
MSQHIRIGIIGAGNIGNVHMDTFKHLKDASIVAVTDMNLSLAEKRAKEHGIAKVHPTVDSLIADQELDAIIVAVPNQWHARYAVQAMEAGKHVLVEKPMGVHLADARAILQAQRKTGKVVMVGHQMRWEYISTQIKEHQTKGTFGHIYNAKAGWFRRKGIPGWGTWFTTKNESGGGPLIDIGVHLLDLSLYLMGNPKPVTVFGSTYAEFGPKKRGIGTWGTPNWDGNYDVEDLATALIKMDNGSTLSLEVSWAVNMDTDSQPFIHLMGSEAGAAINGNKGKILFEENDAAQEIELHPPSGEYMPRVELSKHFIECIHTGKEPITSALSGFTNNLILEAIYESSRTGHEVKLDWNL